MIIPVTPHEWTVLTGLRIYIKNNHRPPSLRELAEELGLSSWSTVRHHLQELRNKGVVGFQDRAVGTLHLVPGVTAMVYRNDEDPSCPED